MSQIFFIFALVFILFNKNGYNLRYTRNDLHNVCFSNFNNSYSILTGISLLKQYKKTKSLFKFTVRQYGHQFIDPYTLRKAQKQTFMWYNVMNMTLQGQYNCPQFTATIAKWTLYRLLSILKD